MFASERQAGADSPRTERTATLTFGFTRSFSSAQNPSDILMQGILFKGS